MSTREEREDSIDELVGREHRFLDELFAELQETLARESEPSVAQGVLTRLREALERHLLQEERLYYSALRALAPAHRGALLHFADAHATFRTRLAALENGLLDAAPEQTRSLVTSIARDFARHEAGEEELLREIDREIHAGETTSRA